MRTVTVMLAVAVWLSASGVATLTVLARGLERGADAVVLLDGAQHADIDIRQTTGHVWLAGGTMATGTLVGSTELLRGRFEPAETAPEMSYRVGQLDRNGTLKVSPGANGDAWSWASTECLWKFYLNPMVPVNLDIETGTGQTDLALGGLLVESVNVNAGAGDVMLDLSGDWRRDMSGTIEVGAGDLTILVPRNVGTRIVIDQGSGDVTAESFASAGADIVNAAYGSAGPVIELHIKIGAGDIQLVEI